MTAIDAFRDLLLSLADVYAKEDREGARVLVDLYRLGAETVMPSPTTSYAPMNRAIISATEGANNPTARAARAAHTVLPWARTGKLDSQITEDISSVFAVCLLVGPGALVESETIAAGLYVQRSGAFYPAHAHAAEETYVMLAGAADWQESFGPWRRRSEGDVIHHPSNVPHATRTNTLPILASWRWSGDIRPETYRMVSAG